MSDFITWDKCYETGNYVIDYQHKRLIRTINDLYEINENEELKASLLSFVMDELFNYTKYHFSTEEKLMKEMSYSLLEEHQKLHRDFIAKMKEFNDIIKNDHSKLNELLLRFLKEWLMSHIKTEDVKIISALTSQNGLV